MKITEGGAIEISVAALDKPADFTLTLGGEAPVEIHLTPSQEDVVIIPVREIEGISELMKKGDKIRLLEITLNFGVAKIKFGRK